MNKIKWEEHYDDLLFDFIQFRSEHPNGNLSDSIKDFKSYMTKEEQPFQWSENIIDELDKVLYRIKEESSDKYFKQSCNDVGFELIKTLKSKQQTNTIPSGEPKPMNDFMEETKITVPSQPKTERIEVKDFEFDMHMGKWLKFNLNKIIPNSHIIPSYYLKIKQAIESVLNDEPILKGYYSEEQLREAEEKAFNAAREMIGYRFETFAGGGSMGTNPAALPEIKQKYPTFEDYKKLNP